MNSGSRPILCLDFDGVVHRYDSGWKGIDVIPDPPTDGLFPFLLGAVEMFEVHIFSSRSRERAGIEAMGNWLYTHAKEAIGEVDGLALCREYTKDLPLLSLVLTCKDHNRIVLK